MSSNIKMFNLRLTGPHEITKQHVQMINEKYKIIIGCFEDIAWQNKKPEKPHVHVLIETTQCAETVKKFINSLGYYGNEQYKIGKKVDDNVERVIQYACKGNSLGDTTNVFTEYIEDEKIKLYNKAFWEEKIDNDNKFKKKYDSLTMSVNKIIENRDLISDEETGLLNYNKLVAAIIKEYQIRNIGHSKHVIERYINLCIAKLDLDAAVNDVLDGIKKYHDLPVIKVKPAMWESCIASEKIDKYISKITTDDDGLD